MYYILTGSSVDFYSNQFSIIIDAGEIIGRFNLSIICDGLAEDHETFDLALALANETNGIIYDQSTAVVEISDSTSECYTVRTCLLEFHKYLHICSKF